MIDHEHDAARSHHPRRLGSARRARPQCRRARQPGDLPRSAGALSERHARRVGRRSGPARRADGQLRGRPHQPRRRPRRLPGPDAHRQEHPRRRRSSSARRCTRRWIAAPSGDARAAPDRPALGRRRPQPPAPSARARRAREAPRRRRASFVHVITDGRDTSPTGGRALRRRARGASAAVGVGRIASVSGRYYAMDRDKRWERTKLAYDAIVHGAAPPRRVGGRGDRGVVRRRASPTSSSSRASSSTPTASRSAPVRRRRLGRLLQLPRRSHAAARAGDERCPRFDGFDRGVWPQRLVDDDDRVRAELLASRSSSPPSPRPATSPRCSPRTA